MPTTAFFEGHPPFPRELPLLDIPTLSHTQLLAQDASASEALWKACTEDGFFLLRLDGEDAGPLCEDVVKVYDLGRAYFDLPLATKQEFPLNTSSIGYKAEGTMKMKDGRVDLAEILALSRDSVYNDSSKIPTIFDENRALLKALAARLHAVSQLVLGHLARHLEVRAECLDRLHGFASSTGTQLRFVHNRPQSAIEVQTSLPGHSDSGTLTVLFNVLGGLQVLPAGSDDSPENWRWIKPQPGCAIINVGDALVQLTGGVLRSAFHRVLSAPGAQSSCERYSFGYFLKPAEDAPMDRLQEGNVIPRISPQDFVKVGNYEQWHRDKNAKRFGR